MKNGNILSRAKFSLAGLRHAWSHERSFRTQVMFSVVVVAVLVWEQPPPVWWIAIALALAIASAMELVNAAIEALADRLHPEPHPQIGQAKDMASAAAFVLNSCCGIIVLLMLFR